VLNDPAHPFRQVLAMNDMDNWNARAPMRLFHASSDPTVPYGNAEVAERQMSALGSKIDLVDLGNHLNHTTAILPAFIATRIWFDEIRHHKKSFREASVGFLNMIRGLHPLLSQ
jgi:hypothetical protein